MVTSERDVAHERSIYRIACPPQRSAVQRDRLVGSARLIVLRQRIGRGVLVDHHALIGCPNHRLMKRRPCQRNISTVGSSGTKIVAALGQAVCVPPHGPEPDRYLSSGTMPIRQLGQSLQVRNQRTRVQPVPTLTPARPTDCL